MISSSQSVLNDGLHLRVKRRNPTPNPWPEVRRLMARVNARWRAADAAAAKKKP